MVGSKHFWWYRSLRIRLDGGRLELEIFLGDMLEGEETNVDRWMAWGLGCK